MSPPGSRPRRFRTKLGWFVLLYCGSAAAFAAFTYGFRALIPR